MARDDALFLAFGRRSPVAGRRSPVASRQSPVASRQSPVASRSVCLRTRIHYQLPVVSDGETRARRPGDNDVIAPRLERARTRAGREARRGDTVRNATRRSAEFYVADRPHVASATGHHTQAVNEVASLERELHRARRRCWLDPHEVGYVGLTRSARQHHHERTPTYATHNNVPRSMRNATVK